MALRRCQSLPIRSLTKKFASFISTKPMPFAFSHRKATQALNFFARKSSTGAMNKMKALKLVYFADRYHLRRFGRPVVGDEYLAMNYGPVASGTKDIAEMSSFLGEEERTYAQQFLSPHDGCYEYSSIMDVDPKVFSASDREALSWAWDTFGSKDQYKLAEVTHAYPEWTKHEAALKSKSISRAPMSYRDFLAEPLPGFDPCFALDDDSRAAVAEGIDERAAFERVWQ